VSRGIRQTATMASAPAESTAWPRYGTSERYGGLPRASGQLRLASAPASTSSGDLHLHGVGCGQRRRKRAGRQVVHPRRRTTSRAIHGKQCARAVMFD
jgi:hypothetical protein